MSSGCWKSRAERPGNVTSLRFLLSAMGRASHGGCDVGEREEAAAGPTRGGMWVTAASRPDDAATVPRRRLRPLVWLDAARGKRSQTFSRARVFDRERAIAADP